MKHGAVEALHGHFLGSEIVVLGWAMMTNLIAHAANLPDQELLGQLEVLAQQEREATAALVAHLAVMDERRLYLSEVRLLAPELTPANHLNLLNAAKHKGKREVQTLIARVRPQPTVASTVRQLPTRTASLMFHAPLRSEPPSDGATPPEEATLEIRPPAKPVVVPLSPRRFKVQFTADQETHDLLRRAQDLLRHQIPSIAQRAPL